MKGLPYFHHFKANTYSEQGLHFLLEPQQLSSPCLWLEVNIAKYILLLSIRCKQIFWSCVSLKKYAIWDEIILKTFWKTLSEQAERKGLWMCWNERTETSGWTRMSAGMIDTWNTLSWHRPYCRAPFPAPLQSGAKDKNNKNKGPSAMA